MLTYKGAKCIEPTVRLWSAPTVFWSETFFFAAVPSGLKRFFVEAVPYLFSALKKACGNHNFDTRTHTCINYRNDAPTSIHK